MCGQAVFNPLKQNEILKCFCTKTLTNSKYKILGVKAPPKRIYEEVYSRPHADNARYLHTCGNTPIDKLAQIINTQLEHSGVSLCEKCQHHLTEAITKSIQDAQHPKTYIQPTKDTELSTHDGLYSTTQQNNIVEAINIEQWLRLIDSKNAQKLDPIDLGNEHQSPQRFGEMPLEKFISKEDVSDAENNFMELQPIPKDTVECPTNVDITIEESKPSMASSPQVEEFDQHKDVVAKEFISYGVGPLPKMPVKSFTLTDMLTRMQEINKKCCKEHGVSIKHLDKPEMAVLTKKADCLPPLGPPPILKPISPNLLPPFPRCKPKNKKKPPKEDPCRKCFHTSDKLAKMYSVSSHNIAKSTPAQSIYLTKKNNDNRYQVYLEKYCAQPKSFVKHVLKAYCKDKE